MAKTKKNQMTLYLTDDLLGEIERIAVSSRLGRNQIVNAAIKNVLGKNDAMTIAEIKTIRAALKR